MVIRVEGGIEVVTGGTDVGTPCWLVVGATDVDDGKRGKVKLRQDSQINGASAVGVTADTVQT